MQSAEEFVKQQLSKNEPTFDEIDLGIRMIAARDAEWQARVDAFLEDNNRSEEQVKKQFANAVSFKARAEKAEARVDRLEAALKHIVEVEAKAHATGKYSLAVEWCADKARTALAESEAAHG